MVVYDLVCHLLTLALFAPVGGWLLSAVVRSTGSSVVSNTDLVSFFLSPVGLLLLLGSATLSLALLFLELGGLSILILGSHGGQRVSSMRALLHLFRCGRSLIELGLRLAVRLGSVLAAALVGIALVRSRLLSDGDIYYYLQTWPSEFRWAVGIAALLIAVASIVTLVVLARWIVALPILLVEECGARRAIEESRRWVSSGRFGRVVGRLGLWALAVLGLTLLAGGLGWLLERLATLVAGERVDLILATIGLLAVVDIVLSLAIGVVAAVGFSAVMVGLYQEFRPEARAPSPVVLTTEYARRDKKSGFAVIGIVALMLIAGVAVGLSQIGGLDIDHTVAVTAHRGSSRIAPENTLAAIEQAIDDGADYAEIDVQEIADGSLVLFHDTDLRRVAGVDRPVWELTLEEFREIDVGAWFSPEFAGERVATLEEAIEVAQGRLGLNIELKLNGHERRLEDEVARVVQETDFSDQSFATSLDQAALERLASADSTIRRGLIVAAKVGDATRLDIDLLAVSAGRVDRDLISRAHRAGQEVHVWTVNDPDRMLAMIHMGVDNILTSSPAVLVELQLARSEMNELQRTLLYVSDLLAGRL